MVESWIADTKSLLLMRNCSGKIEVPMDLSVRRNLERSKRDKRKK